MPEPKQVICNGKLFEIDIQGRRVWLDEPPPHIKDEILYDQHLAERWPHLWSKE